ncbi:MAG: TIGR03619 family F420-dependent LLM class oxidoreductase [Chloroflexi bacterium]|nr:TIGR03619 family F420-dependent LLM class oxidoreductase [Chloroflexota bacterium]
MKIGISRPATPPAAPNVDIDVAVLAREAERIGYESFWVGEHPVAPVHTQSSNQEFPDGNVDGYQDCLIGLARASAMTSTIKLGTGVLLLLERNPLLLAKEIATLDRYSGGRFILGVGSGWHREEIEILGGDFDHRWTQTREALQVMKGLWTQEISEFHGKYYDFPQVRSSPKPLQKPHPPVLLGLFTDKALQRVVDHADGWMPALFPPEAIREARVTLDRLAGEAGRDPASISITIYVMDADRDAVRRYEEAGADRLVALPGRASTEREAIDVMERFGELLV